MIRIAPSRVGGLARTLTALLALTLAVAGCSTGVGDAGPLPTPSAPGAPSSGSGLPSATPATSAVAGASHGPSTNPGPSPAAGQGSTSLAVYFVLGDKLVSVERQVPRTLAVARAALTALLAGPTQAEGAGPARLVTLIPPGTQLLDISLAKGIATVDLSGDFQSGGGAASMFGRLAQVVYTLTQFPTVTGVTFRLDGQPVTTFSGEGIVLSGPSVRADYRDDLPVIFLDRPAWGSTLSNPARLSGVANVFEAQFTAEVTTADGTVLTQQPVTASCGTGCWGTFDVTVPYHIDRTQAGWVTVYDLSAKDGTRENVVSYPVTLTAGR